jgi:hypothetical protein
MAKKYELVVDYGKPYSETHKSLASLKKALIKLDKKYESNPDDFAYFDITIYDEKHKDVTEEIFKKFKLGYYKE